MEEETVNENSSEKTKVGFPSVPEKKAGFNFKLFAIFLVILLLLGAGAWYVFGRSTAEISLDSSPTVTEAVEEVMETPTPTEAETVDKSELEVQILNGSGISGAAGKLQTALEALDYENFTVGNASNYSYTATEVTFDTSIPSSVKEEIIKELEKLYGSVEDTSKSMDKYDISIIIGLPKGHTPTVTTRPRATGTVTPTTSTTTGTVTATKTPTPTP